jgi:hypothetical protein
LSTNVEETNRFGKVKKKERNEKKRKEKEGGGKKKLRRERENRSKDQGSINSLLPPEERFIAQEPVPLSVNGIPDSVIGEERVGCVVCVVALNRVTVGPGAERGTT